MALVFLACLTSLQWAWSQARGTAIEQVVIHRATVDTAVALIHALTPGIPAHAEGARIRAPGGGINVLNGCEGTELLFLLCAALLAYPMSWRWRWLGMTSGTVLVFTLNQIRLLLLFYSYRADRAVFDQLHGLLIPLALMMAILSFTGWLIRRDALDTAA